VHDLLEELQEQRTINLELSEQVHSLQDHIIVLQSRIANTKRKYEGVKAERNQAHCKVRALLKANKVLDSKALGLSQCVEELRSRHNHEQYSY
jgi:phage shock protein A